MSDTTDLAVREAEEPIPNPGMHEHQPRPTDVDDAASKRAERQVATLFGLAALMSILFCVSYFVFSIGEDPDLILGFGASNIMLGLTLGLALLFIGVGAIQWARKLMSDGQRPLSVGFFFSLGHSTIVFLLAIGFTVGIRGLSGAVADDGSWLHSATGLIGPTV